MKLAASNLALPPRDHLSLLPRLPEMGIKGLEVVPAQVWDDPWHDPTPAAIAAYGDAARAAGLQVVGLHGLFAGRPDLGLFKEAAIRRRTMDYLVHLSGLCRDLGGRTLILESRWRFDLSVASAWIECRDFLESLLPRIEDHGTVLCFAPLPPSRGDFCLTATDCRILTSAVDHPAFGHHLACTAMTENGEMVHAPFAGVRGKLDHVHLDEPAFGVLGRSGRIDHAAFRRHLDAISYFDWISVVQRWHGAADPLLALEQGARFAADCYLPIDTR